MSSFPCLARFVSGSGQVRYRLGDRLVDRYLEFVAGRCRPNTLRAVAFDLKTFFTVIAKGPVQVTAADVFDFLADQRGDRTVARVTGSAGCGGAGAVRLSAVSKSICCSGRGRSPFQNRAAEAVSGWCWRLTRTMPLASAGPDRRTGLAQPPAAVAGLVSTATGWFAVAAKARVTGSEQRSGAPCPSAGWSPLPAPGS
jgi:hypothetical protein